ncbi:hypothetical protein LCGC14_0579730 [marine sediment metagenome]|uniref:Uncharacterized protein n=1 Tax=marine sediment metagenome TaxID=412755 RepID=A0A0F9U2W6_9ZZZZ
MSKRKELKTDKRIMLYGSAHEIETAEELIERFYPNMLAIREPQARLNLQSLIDTEIIHAAILFDGNTVHSFDKIIKDIKRVQKNGMQSMTNRLYKFLINDCGSIAHYNKQGWIAKYSTIDALRTFFAYNEFGHRVLDYQPAWRTDVIRIVKEIEKILRIPV